MNIRSNSNKNSQNGRASQMKLYSIGSVCLLIVILLLVNILFDRLFGNALKFDFSDSESNSTSQETIEFFDSLPLDISIRIVGLFEKPSNIAGTPYQYLVPLLDDYVNSSKGRINVEYIDPITNPTIYNQLDPTNSFDLSSKSGSYVIQYNGSILRKEK